ncbi:MAG: hypothetical protein GF333_01720 [Candidatus Omnitrophica bacterium]|nr:hypothetical protein [Candidatus Omnitrophota bacterium]
MITFEDFSKVNLRTGRIDDVRSHPQAEQLYLLTVDLGEKTIQLVAGLKKYYSPDELREKNIVVVTNLAPRKIRGELSEGMLLAAQSGDTASILAPEKPLPPGSLIR